MARLNGKVAVVTGGNSGIGLAAARAFVREGARVAVFGRNAETVEAAANELGGTHTAAAAVDGSGENGGVAVATETAIGVRGDVTNGADLDRLFGEVSERLGGVDVLFVDPEIGPADWTPRLSVLSFDIETDPRARRLLSISLVGCGASEVLLYTPEGYDCPAGALPFPAERELLAAFVELFDDGELADVRELLERTFARPTLVVNDAELAGLSVITGRGYEVMLTLGTGLGFAHYSEGAVLPKIEVSAAPFRKGRSFDEMLGSHARRARGTKAWTRDVQRALRRLFAIYYWDRAYLGGGGSRDPELSPQGGCDPIPSSHGSARSLRIRSP